MTQPATGGRFRRNKQSKKLTQVEKPTEQYAEDGAPSKPKPKRPKRKPATKPKATPPKTSAPAPAQTSGSDATVTEKEA